MLIFLFPFHFFVQIVRVVAVPCDGIDAVQGDSALVASLGRLVGERPRLLEVSRSVIVVVFNVDFEGKWQRKKESETVIGRYIMIYVYGVVYRK